jgi:hypothetical protein
LIFGALHQGRSRQTRDIQAPTTARRLRAKKGIVIERTVVLL